MMDVGGVAPPSVPATAGKLRLVLSFPPAPPVELPKIGHVQIPPLAPMGYPPDPVPLLVDATQAPVENPCVISAAAGEHEQHDDAPEAALHREPCAAPRGRSGRQRGPSSRTPTSGDVTRTGLRVRASNA
jgi:hypothetical protein